MKNSSFNWYSTLIKPKWSPPAWLFGPVWSVLYIIIALSYGSVFYGFYLHQIPAIVVILFVLNLIFNASFTYFQFSLKNNLLASIDIILVLVTLIWSIFTIYPYANWIAFVNIPYLAWVSFATVLQLNIMRLNR